MSRAIAIIGGTGTGKTTYTKEIIKGKKHFIFDVNNEYLNYNRFSEISEIQKFLTEVKDKKNTLIVIEEATIFFNNRKYNDTLNSFLVGKRHSKNTFILLFHSLRVIPLYIIDFLDIYVLLKTNDNPEVIRKFEQIPNFETLFFKVKEHPDKHHKEIFFGR